MVTLSNSLRSVAISILLVAGVTEVSAEEKLVSSKSMSLDLALRAATSAMESCRDQGFLVAVAIIEKGGATQVLIRDDLAGIFTTDIALRKAKTALSFRSDTSALVKPTMSGAAASGLRHFPDAIFLGGGVRVEAGGVVVGAIGVSGAPRPEIDDACAKAGIEAISDILDFS